MSFARKAHEEARHECIKQTANPDPDSQFLSDWLHGKKSATPKPLTALPLASTPPVKQADAGAAVQEPVPAPLNRLAALPLTATTQPEIAAENQGIVSSGRFFTERELLAYADYAKRADAVAAVQEPVPAPPKPLAALSLTATTQLVKKPPLPPGYYGTGAPSKAGGTAAYPRQRHSARLQRRRSGGRDRG